MAVYKISANGKEGRIDSAAFEKEYDVLLKKYPDLKVRVVKGDQPGYIPASNYHKAIQAGFKPYIEPDKPATAAQHTQVADTPANIQQQTPKQQEIDLTGQEKAPAMIKTDPNLPSSPEQQLEAEMTKQGEELLQQDEAARQALKEQAGKVATRTEESLREAKKQYKSVSQDIIKTNQFAYTPIGGSPMQSKVAVASPEQQKAYRESEKELILSDAAKRKAEIAQKVITEIERSNKNFFIAAGRGIGQTVSDIDNWDMGATDFRVNKAIQHTADKFAQDPESLTDAERDLLEATALEIAISDEFGDELTRGYKAGQVTGEALPFMAEIALNPLSGTGRAATSWALKKFGQQGLKFTLKRWGIRAAADAAGAAGMAATTGLGHVAADTQARMTGQAQTQVDENGYVVYTGHAGGEELPSALAKAYGAQTIEYFSEMSGDYFAKIGLLTRKITPKRVLDMLDNIKASDWAKVVDDFATKTQWQGTINEWAEEQVGTALNALFVGDQEISDLWDLDQQIDTFLGVALMGGAFSIAKTAGYRTPKYRAAKELEKARKSGLKAFGAENWEDIQAEIDNASDEQLHAIVKQAVNAAKQANTPQQQDENNPINLDDPINNQDRDNQIAAGMIIANYVAKLQQQRGANIADIKRKTEGEVTPEQLQLENSFYEGVNRRMSIRKAKKELDEASKEVSAEIDQFIESPEFIASLPGRVDADRILRYANAKARYDGLTQAYADDIEDQVQSATEHIKSRTDKAGNLTLAETITGEKVHIISGNIAFDQEGFVDKAHSEDKPVIVVDQEGNKKMLSLREISRLLDQTNADEATNAIAEEIRNTVAAQAEQEAETPEPEEIQQALEGVNVQDVVQLNLNEKPTTATIQSIDPATGEILLQLDEPILNEQGKEQKVISMPADQFTKALIRNDKPGDEPPAAPPAAAGQLIQTKSTDQPTIEAETQAQAPVKEFPKDKEGYIDYSQITEPQDFLDALMTEFSPEDAAAVVEDYVAEAEKAIKAAEKEKDPVKKRRKVAAERANAEKYIQMRDILKKRREAEQAERLKADIEKRNQAKMKSKEAEQVEKHKADIERRRQEELENLAPENLSVMASDYLLNGGVGSILSSDFYLQGLSGTFINASKKISEIKNKYASEVNSKYADINSFIGTELYNAMMDEIRLAIKESYTTNEASSIFDTILQYPTGVPIKIGTQLSIKLDQINNTADQINAKYDAELKSLNNQITPHQKQQAQQPTEQTEPEQQEDISNVPDISLDSVKDARARGFRKVDGVKVERKPKADMRLGAKTVIKFALNDEQEGAYVLTELDEVQPSHINDRKNPLHFLNDAQPKKREKKQDSKLAAGQIAKNFNPVQATENVVAYHGAPIINARKEVIQGNGRTSALHELYNNYQDNAEAYKQYLIDNAQRFGVDPEEVRRMKKPALVRLVDVSDERAIQLGNYGPEDIESGVDRKMNITNVVNVLGEKITSFVKILYHLPESIDEENRDKITIRELAKRNGENALKYLFEQDAIGPGVYESAFSDTGIKPEFIDALMDLSMQLVFKNGKDNLKTIFEDIVPSRAQMAIIQTIHREADVLEGNSFLEDIQEAIEVCYYLSKDPVLKKTRGDVNQAIKTALLFSRQSSMDLDGNEGVFIVGDKYSELSIVLAAHFYGLQQKELKQKLDRLYDDLSGQKDIFAQGEPALTKSEVIKKHFNVEYNERRKNESVPPVDNGRSLEGGQARHGDDAGNGSGIQRAGKADISTANGATPGGEPGQSGQGEHKQGAENIESRQDAEPVDIFAEAEKAAKKAEIKKEEEAVNTDPSQEQKEAGNYKKGHIQVQGLDITIENPKGSERTGTDQNGKKWSVTMNNTYGYFKQTKGKDGDQVDVFIGENPLSETVFVVDQINPQTGEFDESKVMLGFDSEEQAQQAYMANYSPGWKGFGSITQVPIDKFKTWLNDGARQIKAFAEYKEFQNQVPESPISEDKERLNRMLAEGLGSIEKRDEEGKFTKTSVITGEGRFDTDTGVKYPFSLYNYYKHDNGDVYLFRYGDYLTLDDAKAMLEHKDGPIPVTSYHGQKYNGIAESTFRIALSKGELDKNYDWEWIEYTRVKGKGFAVGRLKPLESKDQSEASQQEQETPAPETEKAPANVDIMAEAGKAIKKAESRAELEARLSEERKQRILNEGSGFDKEFGLIAPRDIKSADDALSNLNKIISTLKLNEGNGKFKNYEGFAYKGDYSKNAGEQVREYFITLDVLPNEIKKDILEKLNITTPTGLSEWAAKQYSSIKSELQPENASPESQKKSTSETENDKKLPEKESDNVDIQSNDQNEEGQKLTKNETEAENKESEVVKKENKDDNLQPDVSLISDEDLNKEVQEFEDIIKEREEYILKSNTPLTGSNSGTGTLTESEHDRFTALTAEQQRRSPSNISAEEAKKRVAEKRKARLEEKDKAKEDPEDLFGSNQDDALPKLDDFGEKIGGARKDMDIKRNARDTDSQPAWRRKYRFANADGSITIGAKVDTSKPFTVAYEKKGSFGRSYTRFIKKIGTSEPMIFNSEAEAEAYIPIFEVYAQNYRVDKNGDQFVIGKRASTGKMMEFNSFPTKEEALAYLFSTEGATSLLNRKRENFSIPALDKVERTGKDYRNGRNIDTDEFMNTFGFRGGEFGEWVKPLERQTMLNAAYDSFMDLADMLGIPPRALSLAGNLSIAFGARGSGGFEGGAKAHFESGRAVINLTRMNGAGSLAHEWAHAADNYFAIQKANLNYDRDEKGEVKAGDIMLSRDNVLRSAMRPELYRLFRDISEALKKKQVTQVKSVEEKQKLFDNALKPTKREADALINKFTNGIKTYKYNRKEKKYDTVTVKATDEQVAEAKRLIEIMFSKDSHPVTWEAWTDTYKGVEIEALDALHKKVFGKTGLKRNTSGFYNLGYYASRMYKARAEFEKAEMGESETLSIDTEFYKNSKEFDKTRATPYFAQTHEMFARAFEYFIQTKLDERKDKSDYLQYDKAPVYEAIYGISPYPSGEERTELNKLFQAFFDELKTKEDENKNVIMFRKSDRKADNELETIKQEAQANGTFMKAPNGKPSNLNERQWLQVRTKAFKEWFGDWEKAASSSKVLDENGEPLVVYRGHDASTNVVSTRLKTPTFTNDKSVAQDYADDNENGIISETYLSIKNPLEYGGDDGVITLEQLRQLLPNKLFELVASSGSWNNDGEFVDYQNATKDSYIETFYLADNPDFIDWAKQNGYDGFRYSGFYTGDVDFPAELRPFNANQIKSATDNTGSFDADNNDIRFRKTDAAGFYSTVEAALESIKQDKGTPGQMKAMLLKNGAKQAELDWMGWDDQFPDARKKASKEKQLDIIQSTNPMRDDNHVGIRKLEDIKTFDQIVDDPESFVYGDFSKEDAQKAIKEGSVTVYSSTPIKNGAFVSTSEKQAKDYAGNGKVYSQKVNLGDVAWINGDEGQLAKADNTITKADVQDWIDQNRIEVEEVVKGDNEPEIDKLRARQRNIIDGVRDIFNSYNTLAGAVNIEYPATWHGFIGRLAKEGKVKEASKLAEAQNEHETLQNEINKQLGSTKYSQYQEPGGKNYKELLLTMPGSRTMSFEEFTEDHWGDISDLTDSQKELAREQYDRYWKNTNKAKTGFKSDHFEEPNILAHVRFNERTMPNGEKVLFIEEIQSDWAQKGKKEGFKSDNRKAITEALRKEKDNFYTKLNESEDKQVEYGLSQFESGKINREQLDKILLANGYSKYDLKSAVEKNSVPDMPFKKTDQWVNLAVRRMMRYAAENGFDRIAWTNGEQQAARYDLSKQVDKIEATKANGFYMVNIIKNGQVIAQETPTEKELPELVGKELAQKIVEDIDDGNEEVSYSGLDLKVGGEGMKAFYDAIVPSAASKLGKPFGAKVEQIELPVEAKEAYDKSHDRLELSFEAQEIQDRYIDSMQDEESDYTLEQYVADMKDAGYEVLFDENGEPENLKKITKGQTFTVQSIPVTDKMYESVMQGIPLYKMTEELRQKIGVVSQAKLAVLRSFFDNVSKEAVNAVDIVVVDSRDELPQELQNKMPDDLDVQGFYYTGDNKAYFILNEIQRPELAFRTWVHEVGVHAGLRSIIPARDFSRLMRKIYNDLGQDEIRRVIPKVYWSEDIEEQAEEYLAFIGEKIIKQEDLSKKEQSIWNKIVDLFHEVLNKLYKNGRFTKQDAESLVMASVQNSFRGSNGKLTGNMLSGQSGQTGILQRNDRTPATADSGAGEGTIFAAARDALKRYEQRKKETAAQLQINWEAESGDVPARRDKAIASSTTTSVLQRKAGYDPDIDPGISYVERLITNRGHVTFMGDMLTGPARIKSAGDIAFIFKNLESAATENTFFVFMNDKGEYRVLYVGTGSSSGAVVDVSQIAPAAKEFGATKVCMVHNHPSGNLNPSSADAGLHRRISAIADKLGVTVMPSIIINTDSGEYAEFDNDYPMIAGRPTDIKAKPVDVYQFDRQKLYKATKERKKIRHSRDVAEFLSQQKRGAVDKLHLIIADRQSVISRYLLVDGKIKTDDLISLILEEAGRHGETVFIATNGRLHDAKYILESVKAAGINLLDVLEIKQNDDIVNNYRSLADQQVLEPEGVYGSDKALFRKSDKEEAPETQKAQDVYEKALEKTTINIIGHKWTDINRDYLFKEGYQDSMLSLKIAQEAIAKETDSPIQDFEDAYTAENHLSSRGAAETEAYNQNYLKPMFDDVKALTDKGAEYEDVKAYVMAKHGLERNRLFAWRDALKSLEGIESQESIDSIIAEHDERVAHFKEAQRQGSLSRQEVIDKTERLREGLVKGYKMFRKDDYSGLTDLTNSKEDFEEKAEAMVEAFEEKYPEETADLWDSINAATKRTLQKQFEGGLLTREMHEYIRGMFEYYVPLRGFDEDTASDMYEYYFTNESSFNAPIKKAEGRKSLAEDPFANIGNMAQSGILQANRNLMKQKLLNLALNHPTSLLTVREVWYKNEGTTEKPKWVKSFPEFPENATPEQAEKAIQEHDKLMRELEASDMAQHKRTKVRLNYKASKRQISEHIVMVKSAGKEYAIYVNGNPRMAQAVNGLTNPDAGKIHNAVGQLNRQLAANYTTRNLAFVFRNMSRDIIFASTAVNIKEDAAYRRKFRGNLGLVMFKIWRLMAKFKKGTLDMDNPIEKAFYEFISSGGETGYTALYSLDKYKSMMQKHIRKAKGITLDPIDAGRAIVDGIGSMNRCAEDISRFAVYYTSRKQGRSVQRSIKDAKEITVNFNKKGSGVMGARHLKAIYLFFNPAVQSLDNFSKLAKKNPKRFTATLASYIAAGVSVPVITSFLISLFGDDDDKEAYNNLPDWIRRNSLCIFVGNGKFVTIPLPIEMRAFYGLGELFTQWASGHMKYDNVGLEVANQILDLLPLNPIGAEGDIAGSITPDFAKPFVQVWRNKDYFGRPVYKKHDYNTLMPAWTKAYAGTNKQLVKSAELLNDVTGGDKYTKGLDVNPAAIEHIFEGYFGGMGKTINQLGKTIGMIWSKDDRQWRNVPVLNSFFNDTKDSKSAFNEINKAYYYYMDEFKETAQKLRGYEKEANLDIMGYAEKLDKLYNSPAYERYEIWYGKTDYNGRKNTEGYKDYIKELQDDMELAETPEKRKEIELDLYQVKAELIQELEATEKKKAKELKE